MSKRSLTFLLAGFAGLAALAFLLRDAFGIRAQALVIATLVESSGPGVARDFAAQPGGWSSAPVGARLGLGDGLRTGHTDTARLELADSSELSVMPDTTLRFLTDAVERDSLNVDLQSGEALVRTAAKDLSLRMQVGSALLKAGSAVRLDRGGADVGISVQLGSLRFRDADGASHLLESGGALRVSIGMAVLDSAEADADIGASADASIIGDTDAGLDDAGAATADEPADPVEVAAPEHINVTAPAGESFVLHAPDLPVAVSFDFASKCPAGAELELQSKRQRARGSARAALSLSAGLHKYVVRCVGKDDVLGRVVLRGSVRVLKDAGTRKLPPRAPSSAVDADGRTYTIYYPNQLPDISLRWPNAPSEQSYELEIDGHRQTVPAPEHVLKSGTLRDGTHQISFHGTTRRSRTTTIDVRFDNNAPTASLIEPKNRSFSAGQQVKVEGVALQSWKVSLQDGTILGETDGRFSGTIAPTLEHPDITVRLSHPHLGIHYYLRRAATSP